MQSLRRARKLLEAIAKLARRKRERDVLVAGQPNNVFAASLEVSVRTVEVHRTRLLLRPADVTVVVSLPPGQGP